MEKLINEFMNRSHGLMLEGTKNKLFFTQYEFEANYGKITVFNNLKSEILSLIKDGK